MYVISLDCACRKMTARCAKSSRYRARRMQPRGRCRLRRAAARVRLVSAINARRTLSWCTASLLSAKTPRPGLGSRRYRDIRVSSPVCVSVYTTSGRVRYYYIPLPSSPSLSLSLRSIRGIASVVAKWRCRAAPFSHATFAELAFARGGAREKERVKRKREKESELG